MRQSRLVMLLLLALAVSGCLQRRTLDGAAAPVYAAPVPEAVMPQPPYRLDSGDRLRIQVYGQDGLTNSYTVDAGGNINFALVGQVPARGSTPAELARAIAARLRQGYIRAPHVTAEIEAYRPFFILGEVTAPGQYPYVAHMTAETAIAIAGGYSPRARKSQIQITRPSNGEIAIATVPVNAPILPGDTITVQERWF
jgi:polysaccharide export outer membrane protein